MAGSLHSFRHNWAHINFVLQSIDSAWAVDIATNGLDTLDYLSHSFTRSKSVDNVRFVKNILLLFPLKSRNGWSKV